MIKSILQSRRHRKVTESLLNYLENGKAKAISKASELLATSECSLSQTLNKFCLLIQLQLLPRFHRNKRKISFIVKEEELRSSFNDCARSAHTSGLLPKTV